LLLSKGGVIGTADRALIDQLGSYPAALGTVAALMAVFALVPGLPFLPFIAGSLCLGGASWAAHRFTPEPELVAEPPPEPTLGRERPLGDLLDVDDVHVRFHPGILPAVLDQAAALDARIQNMRRHIATEYGFVIPEIRLTDDPLLPQNVYVIMLHGIEVGRARLEPGAVMILLGDGPAPEIPGENTPEPVYGAPARWIDPARQEEAVSQGLPVITPAEVVSTHLLETLKTNLGRLVTRRALRRLLDEFARPSDPERAEANRRLIDDFIPDKVPHDTLQAIMRALLDEQVPVRNLQLILEAVSEGRSAGLGADALIEHVRRRLAFLVIARLTDGNGRLPLIQLDDAWETRFADVERPSEDGGPA
ncbi:MAG: FHIPEP family type III secretion protein, partial [Pseudomonadota bacterium]